jgi:hypothetical protein
MALTSLYQMPFNLGNYYRLNPVSWVHALLEGLLDVI